MPGVTPQAERDASAALAGVAPRYFETLRTWNVRLKVPRLVNPTSKQMSVTRKSVVRRRNIARSTRRRCR
jgi:hypothetical protein